MKASGIVSMLCVVCLVGVSVPSRADSALNAGIQQAQEGRYEEALNTLRPVAERLASNPQAKTDLKTTHVYMAVCYLGLERESEAQQSFIAALKLDPQLQLRTADFPPRVVRQFEKAYEYAVTNHIIPRVKRAGPVPPPKRSSKAPIYIGGGVVAAGVGAAVLLGGSDKPPVNHTPTPCTLTVTPTDTGLVAATEYTFSCQGASDPDNDPLSYRWDFKDGAPATTTESQTKHTFNAASVGGPFAVAVVVSDGKAEATSNSVNVNVKSLTGRWVGVQGDTERTWNITQERGVISGRYINSNCGTDGVVAGSVTAPRNVRIEATVTCFGTFTFTGTVDGAVDNMTGVTDNGMTLSFQRTQ